MTAEQKTNHAFARSLSNAGLGMTLPTCQICCTAPSIEFFDGAGYVIFCPACAPKDAYWGAQTFPWADIFDAVSEWKSDNIFTLMPNGKLRGCPISKLEQGE
ncbi:MAG: hypothetical protein NUV74_05290 [Candidatus Brocadiaceae bacterium]|nr:hypothetical protein [Candidatus Brocadiaceae bacterium]